MSYLSVDNLIGVQPTTSSSTFLQANIVDVYNGTTNYTHITSASTAAPNNLIIPDANGEFVATTGNQTIQSKMFHSRKTSSFDPVYSFLGDTQTGMYWAGTNKIGFGTDAIEQLVISTIDIVSILPIKSNQFRSNSAFGSGYGTAGNVVYGLDGGTNGIYFGLNRINFSTNSAERLNIQDTAITASQPVLVPNGTATNCGISFSSEVNTGLYVSGTGLFFSKAGTNMMKFISSEVFSDKGHNFVSGAASAPAIKAASYTTTGLYWTAGPILNVAVNGTQRVAFESGGVKLYGSTSGNNASYVASGLQYYQEETITPFTFTFGTNTQTATIQLTRIGRVVHFSMDGDVTRTPSGAISSFSSTSAVPLQYRPTSLRKVMGFNVMIDLGGTKSNSYFSQINTDGTFLFTHIAGTTSSAQHTLHAFTCSWSIAP